MMIPINFTYLLKVQKNPFLPKKTCKNFIFKKVDFLENCPKI